MDVALPAFPGREIEFEIGIGAGRGSDAIERRGGQRRASEIGVQDHARGVDERQQRITERLAELSFDRRGQAAECEVERFLVELAVGDFLAQARQHDADAFGDGGMTLAFNQRLHIGLTEKFVRRRQFLKQRGFVGRGHRGRLCHKTSSQFPVTSCQKNLPFTGIYSLASRTAVFYWQLGTGYWQLVTAYADTLANL